MSVIYKISSPSGKQLGYLMGTFHLNHAAFLTIYKEAFQLMGTCGRFIGEVDLAAVDANALATSSLQALSDDGLKKKLKKVLKRNKSKHFQNVQKLSGLPLPIVIGELTTQLMSSELLPGSVDQELMLRAAALNLPMGGLETWDEQLEIMQQLKPEELLDQINHILNKPSQVKKQMRKMIDWYVEGRMKKLYRISEKQSGGNKKLLIRQRNLKMFEKLKGILSPEVPVFVAVGAGHLQGPTGLITQLRKEGYVVGPVQQLQIDQ